MFQKNVVEKSKHTFYGQQILSRKKRAVYEVVCKNLVQLDTSQITISYGARALRAAKIRLQIHTQNIQYLFIFHSNNGYSNAPQYYVIRTLSVSFN